MTNYASNDNRESSSRNENSSSLGPSHSNKMSPLLHLKALRERRIVAHRQRTEKENLMKNKAKESTPLILDYHRSNAKASINVASGNETNTTMSSPISNNSGRCIVRKIEANDNTMSGMIGKEITVENDVVYALELSWTDTMGHTGYYTGPIDPHEKPNGVEGVFRCYHYDMNDSIVSEMTYEGEWLHGKKCGKGVETWYDGSVYQGTFQDDKRDGFGQFHWGDKDGFYIGEWSRDLRHGKGKQKFPNGSTYDGEWSKDVIQGHGMLIEKDGTKYEGEFKDGKKHGEGNETWASGKSYQGSFINGFQKGKGVLNFDDGRRYTGEFDENMFQGFGKKEWPSGEVYEGEWVKNKYEGYGTRSWPDGSSYQGEWRNGNYHGNGIYVWPNGNSYEGEWSFGLKHGRGIYIWKNGKRYEGEYKEGKKCGFGTFLWPDGSEYSGEWKDNQRNGEGEITDGNGVVVVSGLWRDNRLDTLTTRALGSC